MRCLTAIARAVLMAGLTASLPGVVAGPAVAEGGRTAMTSSRYLQARLHGAMHLDERTRNAAANDFGHLVHRTPLAVVRPASAEDIAETIQWAASCGRRVAPRGQGHSVFGRSQVHDGVV
ncbi:MAG: FAD-binding protein, partial [Variovorax sp.]